jgi:threonine/homoserine/homoserine lactone efflux protein
MLLGTLTGFLASVFGWQINLIALQRGMECRKRAAFLVGFGAACADLVLIYCYFAGASLVAYNPKGWMFLKWIGILTILGLSLQLLFRTPKKIDFSAPKKPGAKRYFLLGFIIVVSNPAVFFLWAGIMSFILTHFPHASEFYYRWLFMGGFLLGASSWFLFLAFHMDKILKNLAHPTLIIWASRITATLLLCACLFLAFGKF